MMRLSVFVCILFLCQIAQAQFSTYSFSPTLDSVILLVDVGQFEKSETLLAQVDTTAYKKGSLEHAHYLFISGYHNLFNESKVETLTHFSDAGKIYRTLGKTNFVRLCDAFMVIDVFIKTQFDLAQQRSEQLLREIDSSYAEPRAFLHNILAACHCGHFSDIQLAKPHAEVAIAFFKKSKQYRRLLSNYGVLAACYTADSNLVQSSLYIDSAMYYARLLDNEKQIAFLHIRKSRVLMQQKKYAQALTTLEVAKKYFVNNPTEQGQADWIEQLEAQLYAGQGNYKRAYHAIMDNRLKNLALQQKKRDDKINELLIQYETAQKEHQIAVQNLQLKNQRIIGISLVGFLGALFTFMYWRNRQKYIQQQRKQDLEHQAKLLENTIKTTEEERKRIAQDLHDGIGQQLAGLKMSWQRITDHIPTNTDTERDSEIISRVLQTTADDVRNLSHQLMPAALRKLGLLAAIDDCLATTLPPAGIDYTFDHVGLPDRLPESLEISLFRVIQEITQNIVKHAEASNVEVTLFYNGKAIVVSIVDNGVGFDIKNRSSHGAGLNNIAWRINSLKGKIEIDSTQNEGTTFNIRLPHSIKTP